MTKRSKKIRPKREMSNKEKEALLTIFDWSRRSNAQNAAPEVPQLHFSKAQEVVPPTIISRSEFIKFPIPQCWRKFVDNDLEIDLSTGEQQCLNDLMKELSKTKNVDISNYAKYFHDVLWMEESSEIVMTRRYNLNKVTMTRVRYNYVTSGNQICFELEVKGLAEKRPSLIRHDIINIRKHANYEIAYQGTVINVFDKKIHIGFLHADFLDWAIGNSTIELDVSFEPNQIRYIRMHKGLDFINKSPLLLNSLFCIPYHKINRRYHNRLDINETNVSHKEILTNPEQKQAVQNIVNFTSGSNPYIIVGPPGTGKTITMVEAILQITKISEKSHILVCASTNESCDMLTQKLIQYCKTGDLIRVYSSSYSRDKIHDNIKQCSNLKDRQDGPVKKLKDYRILVTTLITSGRYLHKKTPHFRPTHVFIDEAAQASEPEAVTAIALLSSYNFHIVLAGDSQQMGPYVMSQQARRYGLHKSLLETLMNRNFYKDDDLNYITKLRQNFRSHPYVLHLPNKLFYNDQLEAMSEKAKNDPIASIYIYFKIHPQVKNYNDKVESGYAATEFYSVFSDETRNSHASYYNLEETEMVLKTVVALCSLTEGKLNPPVTQNDIGIITPYNGQVFRIRAELNKHMFQNVEVGSPETFQGREKRIIIISTVRANQNDSDAIYNLGFVSNPQRFNVAVTRAMSKLIVIGCPSALELDEQHWLQYIKYCVGHNSYFGEGIEHFNKPELSD